MLDDQKQIVTTDVTIPAHQSGSGPETAQLGYIP